MDDFVLESIEEIYEKYGIRFQLLEMVGKGGQKYVYKVSSPDQDLRVLKLIQLDDDSRERAKREVLASNVLNSNYIPTVFYSNVSEASDKLWVIEEFVPGASLREVFNEGKHYNAKEILFFLRSMLDILYLSEKNNIVHRDIKPENIIYDERGNYWLIDFGIARHLDLESITSTDSSFGPCTVGYSSAEQFRNRKRDIDIRADLFSLGVVASEMANGYNFYTLNQNNIISVIKSIESQSMPDIRIEGDTRFYLSAYIRTLTSNRLSRRPLNAVQALELLDTVEQFVN